MRDGMKSWNNLVADQRVDAIAATVQRVCLLVVFAVELLTSALSNKEGREAEKEDKEEGKRFVRGGGKKGI